MINRLIIYVLIINDLESRGTVLFNSEIKVIMMSKKRVTSKITVLLDAKLSLLYSGSSVSFLRGGGRVVFN
jgi:hypothetical protein